MRGLIVLVSCIIIFPACSRNQVADNIAADGISSEIEASQPVDVETETSPTFESIDFAYQQKLSEWHEKNVSEMSPQEQMAHSNSHPASEHGDALIQFASENAGSTDARRAWLAAVKYAQGASKQRAASETLKFATEDPSSSMESLETLMTYSVGDAQKKAMQLILDQAKTETDPKASLAIIEKVAMSRRTAAIYDGVILMPGNAEVQEQAWQVIWDLAAADTQSDQAIKCFEMLFQNGSEELRKKAFEQPVSYTHLTLPTI